MAKKKKKKGLTLGLLLLLLAVLIGGLFGLRALNKAQEEKADGETAEEKTYIVSRDIKSTDITEFSYQCEGETLTFVKEDDTWKYKDNKDMELNQSKFTTMTGSLAGLTAKRVVEENLDHLSTYGLDAPSNVIHFKTADSEMTLYLGIKNEVTGDYYLYVEGGSAVYTVSTYINDDFSTGLYDLLQAESLPAISQTELTGIELSVPNGHMMALFESAGDTEADYSGMYSWFLLKEDGIRIPMDETAQSDLIEKVTSLTLGSLVSYEPAEEELKTYGLDAPAAQITVHYVKTYEEQAEETESVQSTDAAAETAKETSEAKTVTVNETLILYIGKQAESGDYYVKTSVSNRVSLMAQTTAEYFLNLTDRTFINKSAALNNIKDVDSITAVVDGTTIEYSIKRETVAGTDSETGEAVTEETETYYKDGTEMAEDEFKSLYQQIIGIKAEQVLAEDAAPSQNTDELTFTFHRNTETFPEITISYAPYDSSFYQMTVNGVTQLLVNKRDIANLKTALLAPAAE